VFMDEENRGDGVLSIGQYNWRAGHNWSREHLLTLVRRVLKTEVNLDFLLKLDPRELEILVACMRNRISQAEDRP
jgi:hypothetical protein